MKTKDAIYSRTSIGSFNDKPTKKEVIDEIVNAGNYAPIFGSIHFTVVENLPLIEKVKNTTIDMMKNSGNEFAVKRASDPSYNPMYNAPVMVVVSALNGNDKQGFNMANVAVASQNMLLMATDMGVGSRYVMAPVMALSAPNIANKLNLPDSYEPLCIVLLGYTDTEMVKREKKKENVNYVQ